MANTSQITQDRLKELLYYDPETGVFTWKVSRSGRVKVGQVAGCVDKQGYHVIRIDFVLYRTNRLAYLYVHNELPYMVDHRNTISSDNRISNLRAATRSQNGANSVLRKDNTSGYKGVYKLKSGKWAAILRASGSKYCLGVHARIEDAAIAYMNAAIDHFGEFARYTPVSA